ncbi:MAG: iron ABC transporter permease [Tissierellales bacterium]|jgi:iron(III) transport system permease protein|nr:iron ABC transporter permease [Tissierellales bacterium]
MKTQRLKVKSELANMKKVTQDPILFSTIVAVLILVTMFIVFPLVNILKESFLFEGKASIHHYQQILKLSYNRDIIFNTLKLGVTVSILSTIIGFVFAYAATYVKMKHKKLLSAIAILPIISPPFLIGLSAILLFGRSGLITRGLLGMQNAEIYGFHGLVLVQVLTFFPVAYLMLVGLLKQIDPSVEEAARDLGASRWQVFKTVTLPLMVPGIANAGLLVFIQSVADFGNPMVIGGNYTTMAVQIYMQGIGSLDMSGATALAIMLLTISVVAFLVQKFYIGKKSYVTVTGKVSRSRDLITDPKIVKPLHAFVVMVSLFVGMMYILVPIGSFVKLWGVNYSFTLKHFKYVFDLGIKPIADTTLLALIATPISGVLSMVIAFLIARKRFIGKGYLDFTTMLSIAIPGTVVGLGYVMTYNQKPIVLTGTALILVVAFVIRSMPVGIRSGIASLQQIDPSIEEAANVLGASSKKVFTSVTLPMIKPAFFSGLVYSFSRSMTLVSTIIFLVSARHSLLTVAIMSQIDQGRVGVASAYSTILIIIVGSMIAFMRYLLSKLGVDKEDIEM